MTRLECGHDVDIAPGTRLWCYYDMSFGVATPGAPSNGGTAERVDLWWDFTMDGSPYKATGSTGYYNAQRLACGPCGEAHVARSGDLEFVPGTHTLRDAKAVTS